MRTNLKAPAVPAPRTHEGAIAARHTPISELRRTVLSCLLFESQFYESGVSIADRITTLCATCDPDAVAALAIEARESMKVRHVPLLLARELVRRKYNVATLLERIIQRPDEMPEFLALYWSAGKTPVAASVKRGLAAAFRTFNAYALAKYNRADAIKLRDVLFLSHAKPKDDEQAATWKQLIDGTLPIPDTWEVALSSGADKTEAWTRLLVENKLGALALLKNLRNMQQANVPDPVIRSALATARVDRVLPFRFISAAQHAPSLEDALEAMMFRCLSDAPKLRGKTVLLVDGSGSMFGAKISAKSELDRFDAASALAILVREVCERVDVIVFSDGARLIPPRRGFALRDALAAAAERAGTYTETAKSAADSLGYDRIIIITDEQSHQAISAPRAGATGYIVNVASYENGIGYGPWMTINGWSEAILDFISASEATSAD